MASKGDPFYAVKDKVNASLVSIRGYLGEYKQAIANNAEIEAETQLTSLKNKLKETEGDNNNLMQTIKIVETNRARFASISDTELAGRKKFVADTSIVLKNYADEAENIRIQAEQEKAREKAELAERKKKKANNDNRRDLVGSGSSAAGKFAASAQREQDRQNTDYVSSTRSQHEDMESKQNLVLENMSQTLDRLKGINADITTTMVDQQRDLEDLDRAIDLGTDSFGTVLKKINKLLASSQKGRLILIFVLFIIIVILLFLIVYA